MLGQEKFNPLFFNKFFNDIRSIYSHALINSRYLFLLYSSKLLIIIAADQFRGGDQFHIVF
jgi:hypothetical protein